MENFDFIVKVSSGKKTILDKEYVRLVNNVISTNDEEKESRWETYDLIIRELFEVDKGIYFGEIKYRITDGEDPNYVILDIISRYKESELNYLIWSLKRRIDEYIEDDFYKRFFE
jgi:hypothetical protein